MNCLLSISSLLNYWHHIDDFLFISKKAPAIACHALSVGAFMLPFLNVSIRLAVFFRKLKSFESFVVVKLNYKEHVAKYSSRFSGCKILKSFLRRFEQSFKLLARK